MHRGCGTAANLVTPPPPPRRLAKLLGGDLHITDRPDGAPGVQFTLRLPLRPAAPPHEPRSSAGPLALLATGAASGVDEGAGRSKILLRKAVLVVDDSEANRRLARRMLLQLGCAVTEASDGDEVVPALIAATGAGAPLDLVLMDIEMARVDGLAALRELRHAGWATPVIAVTGHGAPATIADCACAPRA